MNKIDTLPNEPSWQYYTDAIDSLVKFTEICHETLRQSLDAEATLRTFQNLYRAIDTISDIVGDDKPKLDRFTDDSFALAREREAFAKEEGKYGFPILFGIAAIRLWSIIEAFSDDVAAYRVLSHPNVLQNKLIKKLKGPLAEFILLSERERAEYLVSALKQQELPIEHQLGISRFEYAFDALGIKGKVHTAIKKEMKELSEVRHVLVHREGRADQKILDRCPWLKQSISKGDQVRVNKAQFDRYVFASRWYVAELNHRWLSLSGKPAHEVEEKQEKWLNRLLAAHDGEAEPEP